MRPDPVSLFYGNNVPPPGGFVPSADRAEISARGSPSFVPPWFFERRTEETPAVRGELLKYAHFRRLKKKSRALSCDLEADFISLT